MIDSELGESAAPGTADRAGFKRLMTDVSVGRRAGNFGCGCR